MTSPESEQRPPGFWRRMRAALPMRTALCAVAAVWVLGCVWSFQEQSAFAASKGFVFPHLLPLVIDGFAVSMAGVSWAASLDARPAVPARLATLVAVAASSVSNGVWAWLRAGHDTVTVALGVAVPIAANLAFEVLLAELRRQVQRRRGLPPPVPVPYPRLIRLVLAPWATFFEWRTLVLAVTALPHPAAPSAATTATQVSAEAALSPAPARRALPAGAAKPTARRKGRGKKKVPRLYRENYLDMAREHLTPTVRLTPEWCEEVTGCSRRLAYDLVKTLQAELKRQESPEPADVPERQERAA